MKEGVPFDTILNQIRDSVNYIYEDNAFICLTKQGIRNIQRDFQLHTGRQHANDYISVRLWVEKVETLREKNPVLYFKEQEQADDGNPVDDEDGNLTDEEDKDSTDDEDSVRNEDGDLEKDDQKGKDFILIIANDFQLNMLEKFGQDIICVDLIHGTNMYNFHLTILMVVDEFRNGIPTAFCLSNSRKNSDMDYFLQEVA